MIGPEMLLHCQRILVPLDRQGIQMLHSKAQPSNECSESIFDGSIVSGRSFASRIRANEPTPARAAVNRLIGTATNRAKRTQGVGDLAPEPRERTRGYPGSRNDID
jgi:hypothetical protein